MIGRWRCVCLHDVHQIASTRPMDSTRLDSSAHGQNSCHASEPAIVNHVSMLTSAGFLWGPRRYILVQPHEVLTTCLQEDRALVQAHRELGNKWKVIADRVGGRFVLLHYRVFHKCSLLCNLTLTLPSCTVSPCLLALSRPEAVVDVAASASAGLCSCVMFRSLLKISASTVSYLLHSDVNLIYS